MPQPPTDSYRQKLRDQRARRLRSERRAARAKKAALEAGLAAIAEAATSEEPLTDAQRDAIAALPLPPQPETAQPVHAADGTKNPTAGATPSRQLRRALAKRTQALVWQAMKKKVA